MKSESISETVFRIAHSYRLIMRSALKANELGLNAMHVKCISLINKNVSCTANDIVNHLARDKAQIARLIKEMMEKKWLTKTANPTDKRSHFLALTAEGKALAKLIDEAQHDVHLKMQENITSEELKEFQRIAAKISANIEV